MEQIKLTLQGIYAATSSRHWRAPLAVFALIIGLISSATYAEPFKVVRMKAGQ